MNFISSMFSEKITKLNIGYIETWVTLARIRLNGNSIIDIIFNKVATNVKIFFYFASHTISRSNSRTVP